MFKVRRIFSIIYIIMLSFLFNTIVLANTINSDIFNEEFDTNKEEFDKLLGELSSNMAEKLLIESQEENSLQRSNDMIKLEKKLELLEAQIESLDGAEVLTNDEAFKFIKENSKDARISKPSNTNTVKWYLYTSYYPNNTTRTYQVQDLRAVGNNSGGMLVTGKDNEQFYTGKQLATNGLKELFSIYVQKGIGSIPVIGWTPYELLFSSSSNNVVNSSYVTHRCVSTISFIFVKKIKSI